MEEHEASEQRVLDDLSKQFLAALGKKEAGDFDAAEEALHAILKVEPRLAEPRMELARILLETDRVADAEPHAREALEQLERDGQWIDDIPDEVVKGIAHALLAEILRRRADEDDVLFGDPDTWRALIDESKAHFAEAAELDPSDATSSYYAFFLGKELGTPTPGA